jgi:hypothetical protein
VDHGLDALDILQHVVVPETQHLVTLLGKIPAPRHVSSGIAFKHMLAAIDLNDDTSLVRDKIREIRPDRRLPTKMEVWKSAPQMPPQLPFRIRHGPPQTPCA